MPITYKFWCEPMDREQDLVVVQQLRLAAEYRRDLAEIENRGRVLERALIASSLTKEERQPYYDQIRVARSAASRAARTKVAQSRDGKLGLHWGTYQAMEDAADHSRRTTPVFDDVTTFVPRDEGNIAIHIQGRKLSTRSVVGGDDEWVRISGELINKPSLRQSRGGTTPTPSFRELAIRVGSVPRSHKPVWAKFYLLMHRPLPEGNITWVKVKRYRVAYRYKYEAIVVMDAPFLRVSRHEQKGAVGVNISWTKVEGGTKIATWFDTDGMSSDVIIPDSVTGRADRSESLGAIRDRNRNTLAASLLTFRAQVAELAAQQTISDAESRSASASDSPLWWLERTDQMVRWRKKGHFHGLFRDWKSHRFDGDDAAFRELEAWEKQDRHLHHWCGNNRRRMSLQIAGRIRNLAVWMAQRYTMIGVERRGMIPDLIAKPKPTDELDGQERFLRRLNARRVSSLSPGAVRGQLELFAKKYGVLYVEVETAFTTADCASCGAQRTVGDGAQIRCETCGIIENRHLTAAKNILHDALAKQATQSTAATKRKMPGRRNRAKPKSAAAAATESHAEGP